MLAILITLFLSLSQQKASEKNSRFEFNFESQWKSYKSSYNFSFSEAEERARSEIFTRNLRYIQEFNAENSHMKLGVNQFAHLTDEEFSRMYLTNPTFSNPKNVNGRYIATEVDWRNKGVVRPIKNQGHCGSCWAFSSISSVESHFAIKTNNLLDLSEQELVDCTRPYGNQGCNGGLMNPSFEYIMQRGISLGSSYPYTAQDGSCKNVSRSSAKLVGIKNIRQGDEDDLSDAISRFGPVSVAIDASQSSFRFYKEGIYYERDCTDFMLNHAVVAVGVADTYYIVRNSWSTQWGDQGYIKMARNRNNNCGIASEASYPLA